jgi:UDP-N-acetylglucosamine 3-dehydrogenase
LRNKLKIAVIGAGYWGTKIIREYLALSKLRNDLELAVVVDGSQARLTAIQDEFHGANLQFLADYGGLLRNDKVDGVHIATPNNTHYTIASTALQEGKHVLIEKPLTLATRDAFSLARLAEEKGLVLQVGHVFRFNNALKKAKQMVNDGAIGKILYANLSWASYLPPPPDRDIIFDLAPHPTDILNYLLDEWPYAVYAVGKSYLRNAAFKEEVALMHLEYPNGVLGNVYVSWLHRGVKERNVIIVGEKATLFIDALSQKLLLSNDSELHATPIEPNNSIQDLQSHFIERINGRGPSFNSALIGALTVQVLETACKSARTGVKVELMSA